MIVINISQSEIASKIIDIEIIIPNPLLTDFDIQLSSWRPGRYELQNFAKNITYFNAFDELNNNISNQKIAKDSWNISAKNHEKVILKYGYFANQMDAGGSYITPQMLYINFINCIFYIVGRIDEPYQINLCTPRNYTIACGLKKEGYQLFADSFYELVDCPLIASSIIKCINYTIENTNFNIWIEGNSTINEALIISDFSKFTQAQFNIFKSFPFDEYHFLLIFLPYAHYHGVEHHNSTVIVLGPDYKMANPSLYKELLGISCHELFHAWNALKIKPAPLTPYDFTKENYFETGFVIEGFTTYYGDYLLCRSGVWDINQYMNELNATLKREFDNFGNQNSTLSRSSVELWLDGYVQGIPNRKVSIYTKGSLFALLLDLSIREKTNNQKSLDDVMLLLWGNFGKTGIGYETKDIISIVNQVANENMGLFFEETIFSTGSLTTTLNQKLGWVGCQLSSYDSSLNTEKYYGFRVIEKEGKTIVDYCEPNSKSNILLAKNDEIIAINNRKVNQNIQDLIVLACTNSITIFRDFELKTIELSKTEQTYFKQYIVEPIQNSTAQMQENFKNWFLQ
jgi:predicted metalloprotease with PDZ domain